MGSDTHSEEVVEAGFESSALTTMVLTHTWIQRCPRIPYLLACLSELLHCLCPWILLPLPQSDPAVKKGGAGHVLP